MHEAIIVLNCHLKKTHNIYSKFTNVGLLLTIIYNVEVPAPRDQEKDIPGRDVGLMFLARAVRMRDLREDVSKSRSTSSWLTELEAILSLVCRQGHSQANYHLHKFTVLNFNKAGSLQHKKFRKGEECERKHPCNIYCTGEIKCINTSNTAWCSYLLY